MSDELTPQPPKATVFEQIKRQTSEGKEFWSSRDLARVLDYADYRNFEQVIAKAKQASFKSGQRIEDHFVDVTEMIDLPKGAQRAIAVTYLSRYACYLIIQNADPSKEVVALGQSYFAVQTRRQELSDKASEDERRLILREEMKLHNVKLAGAAKDAGVIEPMDYAIFQNHEYQGLYAGLGQKRSTLRRASRRVSRFWIIWVAPSLPQTYSEPPKLRKSCDEMESRAKVRLTEPTRRLAQRSGRPFKSWVEPCPNRFQQKRASRPSNAG
jgi:DNA-damage-inducible protein D